jgi:hypothetical protein
MSTKINITVGDQRLFQDSKTRAAANQYAFEARTQQQQLEQQAINAVEQALPSDLANSVPGYRQGRRVAAQSRKKKTASNLQLVGLANLDLRTVAETNRLITASWQATSDPFPAVDVVNRIEVETTEYKPYAELLIPEADKPITFSSFIAGGTPYTVPLNTKQLDWYTAFRADNFYITPFNASDNVEQVRTPPKLPFAWEDLRLVGATLPSVSIQSDFKYTVTSSSADTVYVSTLFRVLFPPDALTFRANDPLYYTVIANTGVVPFPQGLSISFTRRRLAAFSSQRVYQDIAVYTKINTTTKQMETRFQSFSVIDTGELGRIPALQFITYLYADDPLRAINLEYLSTLPPEKQQREALARIGFYSKYYWPDSINYDRTTGLVVALADTDQSTKKDVMNLQLDVNLPYSEVLQRIGGDFFSDINNYTRASFERRGFTFVNTVEVASSLAAVYDAVVPVQAVR